MNFTNINKRFLSRRTLWGATVGSALVFFVFGIVFWGGFNTAMEATNELEFCIGCHEMEENVYREYKPTIHYSNRTGVRATCSDCHVPKTWVHKMVRKVQASAELYHKVLGTVNTPEKFEKHRLTMAKRVWNSMKETDSRECRNCHNLESMNPKFQQPRARKQHLNAFETGQTCIDCHKGIAHNDIRDLLTDEELEELEAPRADYVRAVPELFLQGLAEVTAQEEAAAEEQALQQQKEQEARAAEREALEARIAQAVEEALAAATTGEAAGGASAAAGFGVDWSGITPRDITLFYPGQTSMEWVLNGRDHGGARAFVKSGDTCASCHDKEAAAMGEKMVTGEKAEPTPIEGKRGSIPVSVKAAHDNTNLYLRFEWEDTPHVPVPFVEGGKMDPDNPMKIAVMLAGDDLKYAKEAGCWGTCHHDTRTMPDTPESLDGHELASVLNLEAGITKYVQESRTKIEVKGRRGKKRGGWDQLKPEAENQAAVGEQNVMDLLRYNSGDGGTEDGYIYDQRVMQGGNGFEAIGRMENGYWVVEMKRALAADGTGDINLSTDQAYNFGFAIHDDHSNARFHHVSLGYRLAFDNTEADVNAVAVTVSAPTPAAAGGGAQAGMDVDWSKAGGRDITLFYPGQTSMEWVLNGRDHGGSRAFVKSGDTCASCHDKEAAAMGEKMVTGEKAEPTPIEGKRGSIPVSVKATHDDANLYLRFEWEDTEHAPVPFVEGGKMDPDNPMKIAVMLAGDDLKYAKEAGCWGTCHHDTRTMPDTPESLDGHELASVLNLEAGITKYVQESRTKIEVKGRRGKKRGGWDQLKPEADNQAAVSERMVMDLLRYNSGNGEVEDGYIYDQRVMQGGKGFEATGRKENGYWIVEMKRALAADGTGDISLSTDQAYNFGFAIHDDFSNARFHHVSLGYRLGFDDPEADLNSQRQ